MSQDNIQLVPYEGGGGALAEPMISQRDLAPQRPQVHPLVKLHMMLRGRYLPAIVLAAIGAAIGGVAGWFATKPLFQSTAVIHVSPLETPILGPTQTQTVSTLFDAYISSQAEMVKGLRVNNIAYDAVMNMKSWRDLGRSKTADTQLDFQESLEVVHPPKTEHILVTFTDVNPHAAADGVKAILDAYLQIAREAADKSDNDRLAILERMRTDVGIQRRQLEDRLVQMSQKYGTDDLELLYRNKLENVQRLEQTLSEIEVAYEAAKVTLPDYKSKLDAPSAPPAPGEVTPAGARTPAAAAPSSPAGTINASTPPTTVAINEAAAPGDPNAPAGPAGPAPPTAAAAPAVPSPLSREGKIRRLLEMSAEDIAAVDQHMRKLVDQRDSLKQSFLTQSEKLGPNHRTMTSLQAAIDDTERLILTTADNWRRRAVESLDYSKEDVSPEVALQQLEEKIIAGRAQIKRLYDEIKDMNKDRFDIARITEERTKRDKELSEVNDRYRLLNTQRQASSRVSVLSEGIVPLEPYKDRRLMLSAAGAMAGAGLGFGVVLLMGFRDRRMHGLEDAKWSMGRAQMLGILPSLPDDLSDAAEAAVAADCVHKIRTLLQLSAGAADHKVYSVTSPSHGDGKTSLTLALGLSFSNSGHRTLLIDCDFAGRGLTDRINTIIRRKIGQVLLREGLVTEEQLDQALSAAQMSQMRLGQVLVDFGFVTEADLHRALQFQEQSKVGVLDAISGEPLEACVGGTGIVDMDVLPVGSAKARDLARLSPAAIRRLIDEARAHYDVVVVDTGSVPESLDAALVAAEVDAVVLTVSRLAYRPHVERALGYLQSIGAQVAGVVFNRAEQRDLAHYRSHAAEQPAGEPTDVSFEHYQVTPTDEQAARLGPVARAVASASRGGTTPNNGNQGPANQS